MKRIRKIIIAMALLVPLAACTNLSERTKNGRGSERTDSKLETGGKVDNSYNAPTEIQSKQLTAMETEFWYIPENGKSEGMRLHLKLERNKDKELILSETNFYRLNVKVGDDVPQKIQKVIDSYELVKLNGTDVYTAGLAPQYEPMYFRAEYASGEKLYFRMDGNPEAAWCKELAEAMFISFAR